jgi:ATP-dependent protease HslVU (ClpYQ) peptidase subunit
MTTIVAVQYDDKVVFAADNQVTGDDGRIYHHPRMEKITERNGYLIAGSGEVAPCDIAQHLWVPPAMAAKDRKDTYHFVIAKLMPSLRLCLENNGYDFNEGKSEGKASEMRFNLLIAVNGQIFDIADDLSVCMSDVGFYGVGSGSPYALGALYAGVKPEKAMTVAEKIDVNTSGPFQKELQHKK